MALCYYVAMKIRILDDLYWYRIYERLSSLLPYFEYPIKNNITSPIPYLSNIKNWDIILLDNYFPWEYREEAIWNDFLWQYLKLDLHCKIICLSNVWERIIQRFERWCRVYNRWDIVWFVPSKDAEEIIKILWIGEKNG